MRIWRGFCGAGKFSISKNLLEHLNTVGYNSTDVVEMPGQYALAAEFWMCIRRKQIVRCAWNFSAMRSNRSASSIRRLNGLLPQWMKRCFCR